MVHTLDNHNASLSEGGALPVGVGDFSETPRRLARRTGGKKVEGATLVFGR